jgi:glutamate synthase (NADPH/NADH) small chain
MDSRLPPNAKYAWREVARAEPPKRDAHDRVADFRAVYGHYDEATASEQASRCIQCPHPACVEVCPLNVPVPDLLRFAADGQFREAVELLYAQRCMPELFVHICTGERLCEAACVLGDKSDPVPIAAVSRFLLDYAWQHGVKEPPPAPPTGQRVAVVGSGLCGLAAAEKLSRLGYAVTVFDSYPKPGGRLVNGLPGFRVDKELIERRVTLLEQRGVVFHPGMVCGQNLRLEELRREFDAVFFGLGRANPHKLDVPGARLQNVRQAYPFVLRNTADVTLDTPPVEVRDRRVVVLGGGETAIDALRVAIRCGARKALCIYRRTEADMPASARDVANAREEGAQFLFLSQVIELLGDAAGNVTHVRCARLQPGAPDAAGRTGGAPIAGSEFDVPADVVLVAYGFEPPTLARVDTFSELAFDERGFLVVDENLMTNLPGVFAGGSVVRGPVPLMEVVRDACNAAPAIDRYLTVRRAIAPV